ncbi:MAG: diguanylate cyclase [Thalassobaculaceae bacterium]|nr:diguanylate cyclase [Thalassobaculaceae bacterium]
MRSRILICEDEPLTASMLELFVQTLGEVTIANTREAALVAADRFKPDIILMDIQIAGSDGLDLCRELKAKPETADIPVIFITALEDSKDEEAGFEVGGVDYIRKPVNPYTTRARIKTHLELKAVRDKLASLALRDGLTGVLNRRAFDQKLEADVLRSARHTQPLAVAMIDVDHFKAFNDQYGHLAGDDCLKTIAQTLQAGVRDSEDTVARYGGEEFAVILYGGTSSLAFERLNQLRAAIRTLEIPHEKSPVAPVVTISVGVACGQLDGMCAPTDILAVADAALYDAKTSGRDRVVIRELGAPGGAEDGAAGAPPGQRPI